MIGLAVKIAVAAAEIDGCGGSPYSAVDQRRFHPIKNGVRLLSTGPRVKKPVVASSITVSPSPVNTTPLRDRRRWPATTARQAIAQGRKLSA